MQYRFFALVPMHLADGAKSSQIVFLLDLSYQLFKHLCSTSEQYSPSTSFMSAGHAPGFLEPAPAVSSTTSASEISASPASPASSLSMASASPPSPASRAS